MRTLTVQAANGTNTMSDRQALGKEMESLANEINRIATSTTFAGKTVLNGIGTESIYGAAAAGGGPGNATNGDKTKAGTVGTMTLQVGSNKGDTISFEVNSVMFSKLGFTNAIMDNTDAKIFKVDNGVVKVQLSKADFSAAAQPLYIGNVIDALDIAISSIDGQRANLGAIQNRLESSIRNQSNVAANEADARSRIRDADFAEESANLSQQSIIQQAAASMLMQANTRPQLGLSLLG